MNYADIFVWGNDRFQRREHFYIQFDGDDLVRRYGKIARQAPKPRTDLQNRIRRLDLRGSDNRFKRKLIL